MKYIKSILLLMLLVGLPLVSWYFLNSGLEWRKSKVSDLKAKDIFLKSYQFSAEDKNNLFEIMTHRTCVVKLSDEKLNDNDKAIIDQFNKAHTFKFVSLSKTDGNNNSWTSKSAVRYFKPSTTEPVLSELKGMNYVLVDTAGYIRQYYKGSRKQDLARLVEDIAVILPRKKPKDIVLKKTNK